MVASRSWLLTGSFTNSNVTDGGTNWGFGEVVTQGDSNVILTGSIVIEGFLDLESEGVSLQ